MNDQNNYMFIMATVVIFIFCCILSNHRRYNQLFINFDLINRNNNMEVLEHEHLINNNINLEIIKYNKCNKNYNNSCSICLIDYIDSENIVKLDCGHLFHEVCIKKWFIEKEICPLCISNVNSNEV